MILVDAGPLIALLNRRDRRHQICVQALEQIELPLVTVWPPFTEAMYMVGRMEGWRGQAKLWQLVERGQVQISPVSGRAIARMPTLMAQYADVPMDLADAALVSLAEELGVDRIFTLDSDFYAYRLLGKRGFTVVP